MWETPILRRGQSHREILSFKQSLILNTKSALSSTIPAPHTQNRGSSLYVMLNHLCVFSDVLVNMFFMLSFSVSSISLAFLCFHL